MAVSLFSVFSFTGSHLYTLPSSTCDFHSWRDFIYAWMKKGGSSFKETSRKSDICSLTWNCAGLSPFSYKRGWEMWLVSKKYYDQLKIKVQLQRSEMKNGCWYLTWALTSVVGCNLVCSVCKSDSEAEIS